MFWEIHSILEWKTENFVHELWNSYGLEMLAVNEFKIQKILVSLQSMLNYSKCSSKYIIQELLCLHRFASYFFFFFFG